MAIFSPLGSDFGVWGPAGFGNPAGACVGACRIVNPPRKSVYGFNGEIPHNFGTPEMRYNLQNRPTAKCELTDERCLRLHIFFCLASFLGMEIKNWGKKKGRLKKTAPSYLNLIQEGRTNFRNSSLLFLHEPIPEGGDSQQTESQEEHGGRLRSIHADNGELVVRIIAARHKCRFCNHEI